MFTAKSAGEGITCPIEDPGYGIREQKSPQPKLETDIRLPSGNVSKNESGKRNYHIVKTFSKVNSSKETHGQTLETLPKGEVIPMEPEMKNVVSMFDLGCILDLKDIDRKTRNSEYNPKRFSGMIMRIDNPKSAAQIFRTGKITVMGCRTEKLSLLASRKFARLIQKLGFKVSFKNWRVINTMGVADCGFPIRLEGIILRYNSLCSYEPECFPGLIVKLHEPKCGINIFVSGKVVIYGTKSQKEAKEAFEKVYPTLLKYRKECMTEDLMKES